MSHMKVLDVELALTVSEGSVEGNCHQRKRRSAGMIWQNGPVFSAGGVCRSQGMAEKDNGMVVCCQSINQKNLQWPKWQQGTLRSHTGESPGKEKQNRWSLMCCLNTVNDEAEVMCSGSMFQMRTLDTGKAREPMEVSRTAGTIRLLEVEDRSLWREGTSATLVGGKSASEWMSEWECVY